MTVRPLVWVGIDVGKTSHHACAVDETGKVLWNQKVSNEQRAIEQLIARARKGAEQVRWAIDLTSPMALMLITVLLCAEQSVVYVPGRTVNTMTDAFRGEGKTDAKDARVIAETARLRNDLSDVVTSRRAGRGVDPADRLPDRFDGRLGARHQSAARLAGIDLPRIGGGI